MTRGYDYKNARNAKNGATVEKKQLSEDLCYKETKEQLTSFIFN